jgi:RHS repeat-associated protein
MRKLLLLTVLLFSLKIYAQISGNSVQGSADSKEFVPVGSKEQIGEVDLFTGTYGHTQNLGTVTTPNGLAFSLNLNYSSKTITGQNLPFIDGIPYGEGWNLNLPFISINTASIVKFSLTQIRDYNTNTNIPTERDHTRFTQHELKNNYGSLSWFSPYLNIPGVVHGKLIFKYMRENKGVIGEGVAVFILENFESYVEVLFNGYSWTAILSDGTTYSFNEIMYTVASPTNQRVSKNDGPTTNEERANDKEIIENLTYPNKAATSWYVSKISNPSKHAGYYLLFKYKKFGFFNFHKNNEFLGENINPDKFLEAPRELFLQKIMSVHDFEGLFQIKEDESNLLTTEYLELTYGEDNELKDPNSNMLYSGKPNCDCEIKSGDDLYMKQTIYKGGNYGTGTTNFADWKRYRSPIQIAKEDNGLAALTMHKNNPYLYDYSGSFYYLRNNITSSSSIAFNHSFLESTTFNQTNTANNKFMPGGEIYEIDAGISTSADKFCLFDLNITSIRQGEEQTAGTYLGYTKIQQNNYNQTHDNTIFTTFGQAEKYKVGLSMSQYPPTYTSINQFFTMPVLPSDLANFVVQIGPANSDNDFSISPDDIALNASGKNYKVASTYFNDPQYFGGVNMYVKRTALKCPSNFGAGLPWYMMYQHYATNLFPQNFSTFPPTSYLSSNFVQGMNTWWGNPSSPSWTTVAPLGHKPEATLSKNMNLSKFVINRYSKRPYVLKSAKHYILNAETNSGHTAQNGSIYHKTMELAFNYATQTAPVYSSTIAPNNIYSYSSVYDRYIIVLKGVTNVTDNSAVIEKKLKTLYTYTLIEVSPKTDDLGTVGSTHYYSNQQGGDILLLTKVETASGSERQIIYYPQGELTTINLLSNFQNYNLWEMDEARLGLSKLFSGPSNTYEMYYHVKEIKEKISNNVYSSIKYSYSGSNNQSTSLPSTVVVNDINGNPDVNNPYYCEHFGQTTTVKSGFQYTTVDYGNPTNDINGPQSKIKYTFSVNISDRLFGKLLSSLSYTTQGSVTTNLKKTEYTYSVNKAYENGLVRVKRLSNFFLTGTGAPSKPIKANVALEYDYSDYSSFPLGTSSGLVELDDYFEILNPTGVPNIPGLIRKSVALNEWDLWKDKLDNSLNMKIGLNYWKGATISNSNYFRDGGDSYFIKLTRVKTIDYEINTSNNSITSNIIKDFEYYDADYKGLSSCKGFGYVVDDYSSTQFNLKYEPSWQLYSVKEYSEYVPDEYTLTEKFYYYDLIQKYNVTNGSILATQFYDPSQVPLPSSTMPPYFISNRILGTMSDRNNLLSNTQTYGVDNFMNNGLEALCNSQYFGVRNLLMEERVSTSSLNEAAVYDEHYKSTYYLYKKATKMFSSGPYSKGMPFTDNYTSDIVFTSQNPPRNRNFPEYPSTNLNPKLKVPLPKPIKRLDDISTGTTLDKAAAIYSYTGGCIKISDIQSDISSLEALVKRCLSDNTPQITSSGQLFKLVLSNVISGLNTMYNINGLTKVDNENPFNINSDESVYTEFSKFVLEDFIPMAIEPDISVTNEDYYKLMNLQFEAVKALMCYAIQDTNITINSIINIMPVGDASNTAYVIISGKDVNNFGIIPQGCLPPHYASYTESGPLHYYIQLDKIYTQIDDGIDKVFIDEFPALTAASNYLILTPPNRVKRPILHFKVKGYGSFSCLGNTYTVNINDHVEPIFPYAILKVNEITDINKFGNVSESKNELNLVSRSNFSLYKRYAVYNVTGTTPNTNRIFKEFILDAKHVAMPEQSLTIGDNNITYSETYTYDNLDRKTKIKDHNDLETEFAYDGFSNLTEKRVNGNIREKFELSFFNFRDVDNNPNTPIIQDFVNTSADNSGSGGTADYRSKYNYTENLVYITDNSGIVNRTYYEPSGRTYQTVTQDKTSISTNSYGTNVNYSGLILYDYWGRTINNYKVRVSGFSDGLSHLEPNLTSININNDLKTSMDYSKSIKSRIIETAPFGRDLTNSHTDRTEYYLIDGNNILNELGISLSNYDVIRLLMLKINIPSNNYPEFRFYKTVTYDSDNKKTINYTNIWGQLVANVTFPSSGVESITINGYNIQGKLKQTINPENISTYYKYNWHGNLIEKTSADAGTVRYMYDQAGNIVLEQTAKMRAGDEHATSYYRGYIYDKRGRMIKQYVVNQKFNENTYFNQFYQHAIQNPGAGNNFLLAAISDMSAYLPLTVHSSNPYIWTGNNLEFLYTNHVKYKNINTYFWLYRKEFNANGNILEFKLNDPLVEDCLDVKVTEREWFYDAFPSNYQSYFHSTICTSGTTTLKYQQNYLLGKLALEVSYNSDYLTSVCPSCNQTNKMVYMRFYSFDKEGKPEWEIQQFNENGISTTANANGWVGKVDYIDYLYNGTLKTKNVYILNGAGNSLDFKKQYHYTFDNKGRLSNLYLNNNSGDLSNGRKMASLEYDATFGFNNATSYYRQACNSYLAMDKIEYDYTTDPQNRLTKISTTYSGFTYDLYYDNNNPTTMSNGTITLPTTVSNNFNGNINSIVTKYPSGITNFSQPFTYYGFTYDGNNRLTNANGLIDVNNPTHGDETLTYDKAGNIATMLRPVTGGINQTNSYSYTSGTNLLNNIGSNLYTYDKDGNTTYRPFSTGFVNQMIYGRSNLPFRITMAGVSDLIYYLYSANNIRIHKKQGPSNEFYFYDITGEMLSVINRSTHEPIDWYAGAGKPFLREDAVGVIYNYIYDHLGNTRLVYSITSVNCQAAPPSAVFSYTHAYDYYPYGKILRYNQSTQERMLSTGNERDDETGGIDGLDYRMARMYDCEIGRFMNVDPLGEERLPWSTYNYCRNNPVRNVDPDGKFDGEFERDENGRWKKTSTKGDEIGVDFYHDKAYVDKNGKTVQTTHVTDRKGNWNVINHGKKYLQGEIRKNSEGWAKIYEEWDQGIGPEYSFFEGNHPSNIAIKNSVTFIDKYAQFKKSGKLKDPYLVNFSYLDFLVSGFDGQMQMMGSYNVSFYKLGNKTLSLVNDSKSRTSFYYNADIKNYARGERTIFINMIPVTLNKESNTYQTYLFFK